MANNIEQIKQQIIRLLKKTENNDWVKADIVIHFPPFINKAFNTMPSFWDTNNNRLRIFLKYDEEFSQIFYNSIKNINHDSTYNQIVFHTRKDDYENATMTLSFNQEVEDTFQNNLPKSKRGKTIPWWKNEDEIKNLK